MGPCASLNIGSDHTITPSAYVPGEVADEDLTLPPMDGIELHPAVASLPPLSVMVSSTQPVSRGRSGSLSPPGNDARTISA